VENEMTVSIIRKLDADGELHNLAVYSLEPKAALIAYYMQNEKKTYNTWDYPKDLDVIRERPMGLGFMYSVGDDLIYSRLQEEQADELCSAV
jgi:hypothetical protein